MISRVCLLDINSLSVWFSLKILLIGVLLRAFGFCAHTYPSFPRILAQSIPSSLPNVIHLRLFHCRNLTHLWTRGRFHSSSNCLHYRPYVHYRRHLTRLNTPERRCTTIPVVLQWSLCHRRLSKHFAQWARTTCKDVANSESMVGGILCIPIRYHYRGLLCCRTLEVQYSPPYIPRMIPLYPLNPSQYRDL